jgi:hypothetical protein
MSHFSAHLHRQLRTEQVKCPYRETRKADDELLWRPAA